MPTIATVWPASDARCGGRCSWHSRAVRPGRAGQSSSDDRQLHRGRRVGTDRIPRKPRKERAATRSPIRTRAPRHASPSASTTPQPSWPRAPGSVGKCCHSGPAQGVRLDAHTPHPSRRKPHLPGPGLGDADRLDRDVAGAGEAGGLHGPARGRGRAVRVQCGSVDEAAPFASAAPSGAPGRCHDGFLNPPPAARGNRCWSMATASGSRAPRTVLAAIPRATRPRRDRNRDRAPRDLGGRHHRSGRARARACRSSLRGAG